MVNVKFEIIKQIHRLPSEEGEMWHKELNLVPWNGRMPRYDIRGWNDDHTKMTKGIL